MKSFVRDGCKLALSTPSPAITMKTNLFPNSLTGSAMICSKPLETHLTKGIRFSNKCIPLWSSSTEREAIIVPCFLNSIKMKKLFKTKRARLSLWSEAIWWELPSWNQAKETEMSISLETKNGISCNLGLTPVSIIMNLPESIREAKQKMLPTHCLLLPQRSFGLENCFSPQLHNFGPRTWIQNSLYMQLSWEEKLKGIF